MGALDRPEGSPDVLRGAVTSLRHVAAEMAGHETTIGEGVTESLGAWRGRRSLDFRLAGVGVQARCTSCGRAAHDLADALHELATSLQDSIDEVADYRRLAAQAQQQAEHETKHLDVNDPRAAMCFRDASGIQDRYRMLALETKSDYARKAQVVATLIDALTDVGVPNGHELTPDELRRRVDAAGGVAGLGNADGLTPDQAWAALAQWTDPAPEDPLALALAMPWSITPRSPSEAAVWWRSLRTEQQLAMIRTRAGVIGNLDGLPAWARDLANREQLPAMRERLEHALAKAQEDSYQPYSPYGSGFHVSGNEVDVLSDKLLALDRIEEVISDEDRHLLLLDADSGNQMHAAVSIGDVDSAANVAVFTPGFTSSVQHGLTGYVSDIDALKQRADSEAFKGGHPNTTATIAWLGYDAPQADDILSGFLSVGASRLAERGGDDLAGFYRGLNASRVDDFHLTALGHSYGSTTTGYALQHSHISVDDAVLFGSPGPGTSHRDDLHVGEGHLYDLSASGDVVAATQRFGELPVLMNGVQVLSTHVDRPRDLHAVTGHTRYLEERSTSQWNIAAVTAGMPKLVISAPDREQPEHLSRFD